MQNVSSGPLDSPDLSPLPPFEADSQRNPYGLHSYEDTHRRGMNTPSLRTNAIEPASSISRSEYSSPRGYTSPSTSASPHSQSYFPAPGSTQPQSQPPPSQKHQHQVYNGSMSSPTHSYTAKPQYGPSHQSVSMHPEELEALTYPVTNAYRSRQPSGEAPSSDQVDPSQVSSAPIQYGYDASPGAHSSSPQRSPSYPSQQPPLQAYSTSPASSEQNRDYLQASSQTSDDLARTRSHSASSQGGSGMGEGLGLGSITESSYQANASESDRKPRSNYPKSPSGQMNTLGHGNNDTGALGQDDLAATGGFDEGVLKALCEMDCGMPLVLDRMKQCIASSHEASIFFKKRAQIEEEYAKAMIKLARSSSQAYGVSEGKAGTYVNSWIAMLRTHELVGDNHLKFAAQLAEMSDELALLGKEVDKNRKSSKELGTRLERGLAEQESLVDKARGRFDSAAEELERLLLLKQGESLKDNVVPHASTAPTSTSSNKRTFGKAMSKLKGPKNAAQVAKQEEDVRMRMGQSSDAYRSQVIGAQAVRQEYFNLQLPRILRVSTVGGVKSRRTNSADTSYHLVVRHSQSLKESTDEVDLGVQYHLSRYAYIFESTLVTDGLTVSPINPDDGPGLRAMADLIDIREDFKQYMQQYSVSWQMSGQRGPKRDGSTEDGFVSHRDVGFSRPEHSFLTSPLSMSRAQMASSRPVLTPRSSALATLQNYAAPILPTFGIDLGEQMARDGVEIPRVLVKCCEAIELHGLDSMGLYRLSGTTSRVQRLKLALDRDIEGTDLLSDEHLQDINDIAAVMKLWFRELPEPLLTWELYHGFIEAAKIENDRLRHIRLHERVNELPDPNYATLKFLMGHLDKVRQHESSNQMGCSNIAIVFGPNLLGAPPNEGGGSAIADMSRQCKCVETILQHYVEIFVVYAYLMSFVLFHHTQSVAFDTLFLVATYLEGSIYLLPTPSGKALAGFDGKFPERYYVARDIEANVPDDLQRLIFPWVREAALAEFEERFEADELCQDKALVGHLKLIQRFKLVILQNAAFLIQTYPDAPIYQTSLFQSDRFRTWAPHLVAMVYSGLLDSIVDRLGAQQSSERQSATAHFRSDNRRILELLIEQQNRGGHFHGHVRKRRLLEFVRASDRQITTIVIEVIEVAEKFGSSSLP
ncbi:BQ5605_C021g09275 [Microbotryum silenes-dioicae]|uniref:BQ5605_C021g09275 protein n=1 Tax=Microbotryum silenes-dioicae TaxID=796604 RepID=A0A2X0PKS4_9BASI|nr:BQ5605_C021g09275 [Microbotryum silenes-dioicae]